MSRDLTLLCSFSSSALQLLPALCALLDIGYDCLQHDHLTALQVQELRMSPGQRVRALLDLPLAGSCLKGGMVQQPQEANSRRLTSS